MTAVPVEKAPARIVLIDDDARYRDAFALALSLTLDLRVVATAANVEAGIELCHELQPDLVVCDYTVGDEQLGFNAIAGLQDTGTSSPVVVLSRYEAGQLCRQAFAHSDVSVLSKDDRLTTIIAGLRAILDNNRLRRIDEAPAIRSSSERVSHATVPSSRDLSLQAVRSQIYEAYQRLDLATQATSFLGTLKQSLRERGAENDGLRQVGNRCTSGPTRSVNKPNTSPASACRPLDFLL